MSGAVIQVCIGCKDADPAKRRAGVGGGPALAESMRQVAEQFDNPTPIAVVEYPCLGRCTRKGRLSIAAPGRWSWLFEAIDASEDRAALIDFIRVWLASPDGFVPKNERPTSMRKRMLGRVPPT